MSNDVNNLAHSFVAMAQAFERLPQVQAELDKANDQIEAYAKQVQRLEMRLIDRANEIDNLNAKVRTVEVERDHAETMFLETDDQLSKAKDVLKVLIGNAGDFLRVVEPPKPEPVAEPTGRPITVAWDTPTEAEYRDAAATMQGQSGPLPTSPEQSNASAPVDSGTTTQAEEAPHSVDPTSAPSKGRLDFLQRGAPDAGDVSDESAASSTTGGSAMGESGASATIDPASAEAANPTGNAGVGSEPIAAEGVSVPSDPTPATESSSTNVSDALASPQPDDVGYHNEPKVIAGNWHDWDGWCARMNARYGTQWPPRAQAAQ